MYSISHNHKGFLAKARPGKELPRAIYETFSYAVGSYGFLVTLNETITPSEWIKRIERYCGESDRRNAVIQSIKMAMPE